MDARHVVVMADDEDLLDEMVRLAAAAGAGLERVPDAAALRRRWPTARLVLLDAAGAAAAVRGRLARRDGVVVTCWGEPPSAVWEGAVALGAEHVASLPDAEDWLVGVLADAAETDADADTGTRLEGPASGTAPTTEVRPVPLGVPGRRRGRGRAVAVIGGRGGAGASVLAAAVAVRAGDQGARVLLVDCDPLGGGLDLVVGAEELEGLRWPDLALESGRVAASKLHAALPSPDGVLTVLSCGRRVDGRAGDGPAPDAAAAVVEAGRRAGETVVCDLPRHLTEAAAAVVDVCDLTVLVVPAEVRAAAAAAQVAEQILVRGAVLRVVVRGPAPGGLDVDDVAHALGLDVLTWVAPEPGLAAAMDRGKVPGVRRGPLRDAASAVLAALDAAPALGARAAS